LEYLMQAHSPPCKGGVAAALIKSREATEAPQTGWSLTRNVSKRVAKRDSRATTPSAPFRNGTIFWWRGHPSFTRRGISLPVIRSQLLKPAPTNRIPKIEILTDVQQRAMICRDATCR